MTTRNHRHTQELIRSLNKTAAYGTAFTTKTQMDKLLLVDSFSLRQQPTRDPRMGIAGREFREKVDDRAKMTTGQISERLCKHAAGLTFPFAMGTLATSGSGPYVHVCKATPVGTIDMPTTSMLVRGTSTRGIDGSNVEYQDMACTEYSISGSGSADSVIQLNSSWMGSGRITEDVTRADITSVTKDPLMRMGGLAFTLGAAGGAESSVVSRITSFNFGWNNAMDDARNRFAGGGLYASAALRGDERICSFTFQIQHDGSDDVLDYLTDTNGTRLGCTLTMTDDGGADFVKITIPEFVIQSLNVSEVNGLLAYDVTTVPLWDVDGSGYSSGNNGPATVTLSNAAEYSTVPLTANS